MGRDAVSIALEIGPYSALLYFTPLKYQKRRKNAQTNKSFDMIAGGSPFPGGGSLPVPRMNHGSDPYAQTVTTLPTASELGNTTSNVFPGKCSYVTNIWLFPWTTALPGRMVVHS